MGSLAAIYAAAPYSGVYRQRVMALKYNGQKGLAVSLAYLMAETWWEKEAERQGKGERGLHKKPCLVPVPMHREKEATRGYNQSRLLAEAISRETGFPVRNLLNRPLMGQIQAGLDKKQRREALNQVFQWRNEEEGPLGPAIIIDDVVTTGATLESCGKILRGHGHEPVWGLTFTGGSGAGSINNQP